MKNTRKLIPALAMLLISAVLMSTASFAWFSMNREVTATGMEIVAQSDNIWLAINEGSTFNPAGTATSASTAADEATSLYPVAPAKELTSENITSPDSWHYAYSNDANVSEKEGDYKVVEDGYLDSYVASETFSIGLSNISSATTANNLKLKEVTLPKATGLSVVVVCGTTVVSVSEAAIDEEDKEYDVSGNLVVALDSVISATVTKTGVTVTVYYYINGDDANVTTNKIGNLKGSVKLLFGVDE